MTQSKRWQPEHPVPKWGGSTRETILIAVAALDDALEQLLTRRLLDDAVHVDRLLNGPCGNFGAKIALARVVGVIDDKTLAALEKMRKLRNVAAHEIDWSLADQSVRRFLKDLEESRLALLDDNAYGEHTADVFREEYEPTEGACQEIVSGALYAIEDRLSLWYSEMSRIQYVWDDS